MKKLLLVFIVLGLVGCTCRLNEEPTYRIETFLVEEQQDDY